jgi:chromosome partitioning protein
MKKITVSSFKGGTAKTSTSLHLGAAMARYHDKKVLLIDFDAQANLTTGLGYDPDAQRQHGIGVTGNKKYR